MQNIAFHSDPVACGLTSFFLKLFKIYLLVLMYMHLHSIATEFASNSNVSTCDLIELTTVQQSFHPSATSVVVSSSSPSKKFEHIALPVHQLELNNFVQQTIKILVYKCDFQVQQYRQNHPLFVVSRQWGILDCRKHVLVSDDQWDHVCQYWRNCSESCLYLWPISFAVCWSVHN